MVQESGLGVSLAQEVAVGGTRPVNSTYLDVWLQRKLCCEEGAGILIN